VLSAVGIIEVRSRQPFVDESSWAGRTPESILRREHRLATEQDVRQALRQVRDPEIGKPIEDLGMLRGITVEDGRVRVHVLLTIAGCPLKERIDADVRAAVGPLEGVRSIEVVLGEMTDQERQDMVTGLRGGAVQNP